MSRVRTAPPRRQSPAPRLEHQRLCELELEISRLRAQLKDKEQALGVLDYYHEMFQRAPVGAVVLDHLGIIHDVNWQLRLMLSPGLEKEIVGPFVRFVVKEKVIAFLNHLYEAKSATSPVSTDLLLRTTQGPVIPVEMVTVPMDLNGPTKLFRSIIFDTSRHSTVKEALVRTEQDLHTLVDATQGMFWKAEAHTQNVTYISGSAQNILGYKTQEWYMPGFWRDHIVAQDRDRVSDSLAALVRQWHKSKKSLTVRARRATVATACSPEGPQLGAGIPNDCVRSPRRLAP